MGTVGNALRIVAVNVDRLRQRGDALRERVEKQRAERVLKPVVGRKSEAEEQRRAVDLGPRRAVQPGEVVACVGRKADGSRRLRMAGTQVGSLHDVGFVGCGCVEQSVDGVGKEAVVGIHEGDVRGVYVAQSGISRSAEALVGLRDDAEPRIGCKVPDELGSAVCRTVVDYDDHDAPVRVLCKDGAQAVFYGVGGVVGWHDDLQVGTEIVKAVGRQGTAPAVGPDGLQVFFGLRESGRRRGG